MCMKYVACIGWAEADSTCRELPVPWVLRIYTRMFATLITVHVITGQQDWNFESL